MAKAYTQNEFDRLMNKVEQVDIRVKNYLEFAGYEKWARLYALVHRGWMMTSNIAESINSTLVVPSTDYIYSVSDEGKSFIVCLGNRSCTCKRFQMDGIPCPHAWAVLNNKNMLPDAYCSDFYKPKTVLKTYEVPVYPLPDVTEWNVPEHIAEEIVLPPRYKRPPGRPKKQRDKSFSELSKRKGTNSCSRCGNRGHNKRSCRAAPRNV
ncbi:hypothetical protein H5410_013165 [Solanum commersonii]|uniref:SWIM-type domain-containing protein n=1 Tax=Solanum commersonii TaxID=4109 RepID=A0A9J6AUJ3_SOLCO|nr:hypothetical protein H5410_013165 [Solanum commersonii]